MKSNSLSWKSTLVFVLLVPVMSMGQAFDSGAVSSPGSTGDYNTASRNYLSPNLNFKLGSMNAIGYNGRRLYVGFNFITESLYVQLDKKLNARIGHGKGKFFIGYRFGKKIK